MCGEGSVRPRYLALHVVWPCPLTGSSKSPPGPPPELGRTGLAVLVWLL